MTSGAFQKLNGLVLRQRGRTILQLDDGTTRRLSLPPHLESYIGQRAFVEGTEDGNLIEVSRVTLDRSVT